MLPAWRISTLVRRYSGIFGGLPVAPACHLLIVREAHGEAQGDKTRHKRSKKNLVKYFDIPRIPGVTFVDQQEELREGQDVLGNSPTAAGSNAPVSVNPEFFNRNPRNLEMMNLAVRRTGWALESDTKDYYNKIVFQRTPHHTRASILHTSGRTIVSASTEEFAISKFLYRTTDMSAAKNVGRILGRRMLETGIISAFCGFTEEERKGNRIAVFLQGLTDSGIRLEEGETIKTPNPFGGRDAQRLK